MLVLLRCNCLILCCCCCRCPPLNEAPATAIDLVQLALPALLPLLPAAMRGAAAGPPELRPGLSCSLAITAAPAIAVTAASCCLSTMLGGLPAPTTLGRAEVLQLLPLPPQSPIAAARVPACCGGSLTGTGLGAGLLRGVVGLLLRPQCAGGAWNRGSTRGECLQHRNEEQQQCQHQQQPTKNWLRVDMLWHCRSHWQQQWSGFSNHRSISTCALCVHHNKKLAMCPSTS